MSSAGTATTGFMRREQPRALDLGARQARRLESVPPGIMDEGLTNLATLIE